MKDQTKDEEEIPFFLRLIPRCDERVSYIFQRLEQSLRWQLWRYAQRDDKVRGVARVEQEKCRIYVVNLDEYLTAVLGEGVTKQEAQQCREFRSRFSEHLMAKLRSQGRDYHQKGKLLPLGEMVILTAEEGAPHIGICYKQEVRR